MKRWDVAAVAGLLFPPGLIIAFCIYLGSFNRMLGDDFCTVYFAKRLGLFRSVWFWYTNWHGGFSASSTDWLISIFGPKAFSVHTFLFLAAWLTFTGLAVRQVLRFRGYITIGIFSEVLMAVFVVFTTLMLSPDLNQSLFWWGGVRGYLSPLILFSLYVALYFYFVSLSPTGIRLWLWVFISFGLAFVTGGFSETFTPVFVVLLGGVAGTSLFFSKFNWRKASTIFLLAGFIGALCSLFAMVLAPGNFLRQSYFPASPGLFTILQVASKSYLAFLWSIFSSPYAFSALLGTCLGSIWLGSRMKLAADVPAIPGWYAAIFLLTGLILAFGCFPPAVYGTSEPPPSRTLITAAFLLTICLLASSFLFGEWLTGRSSQAPALSPALMIISCGLIIFSSYAEFLKLDSVRMDHISFAQQWDQVDLQIRAAKNAGLKEVFIPSMTNWAGVLYPSDNPKYWPNVCYRQFYDINVVAPPLQP
jgi:hypothetical protein